MKSLLPFFFLPFAALFVAGCGQRETDVQRATRDGILLISTGAEPRDLDPHVVTGLPEHKVIKSILQGLVSDHPTSSNYVEPGVATHWEHANGYREWTFFLRDNARWSNGDPVTAEDFLFAFQRILNPLFAAPYASMLYIIDGAEAFHMGESTDFADVGVHAPDPLTLHFRLTASAPFFPLMLTHYTYFPVHRPTLERFNAVANRGTAWTRSANFVGNGPFRLTEWLPNQRISVERNPYYWDAENVHLNGIRFFPIEDSQAEYRAFHAGQLHVTNSLPFNRRDRYRAAGLPILQENPYFATSYLGINTNRPHLQSRLVRQALGAALDTARIIDQVTKNGRPAAGFVPPGIEGYPVRTERFFDPERARRLLAEAGHPNGQGLAEIEIVIPHTDTSRTVAEVVQEMWRRELGVRARVSTKEWQVLLAELDNDNFDVFMLGWIGDYMDPRTFLKIMRTGDGNNRTGFANPQFDELIARSDAAATPAERFALLAEAEEILMYEMPIIPMNWTNNLFLLHPDVHGWAPKPLDDVPYKHLRLIPSE